MSLSAAFSISQARELLGHIFVFVAARLLFRTLAPCMTEMACYSILRIERIPTYAGSCEIEKDVWAAR
jgi:hypothetical protein